MINGKVLLASCACALGVACADNANRNQVSASRDESRESPNFGSATDISSTNGNAATSNASDAADIGIGGAPQRQSGNYQSQALPGQSSDQELEKQIKVAITTGSLGTTGTIAENQLTKIDVQVRNGSVVLSGPVSSDQEKQTIQKQVAAIKGVKSVRNNLTVGGRVVEDKPIEPLVPRTQGNQ